MRWDVCVLCWSFSNGLHVDVNIKNNTFLEPGVEVVHVCFEFFSSHLHSEVNLRADT